MITGLACVCAWPVYCVANSDSVFGMQIVSCGLNSGMSSANRLSLVAKLLISSPEGAQLPLLIEEVKMAKHRSRVLRVLIDDVATIIITGTDIFSGHSLS